MGCFGDSLLRKFGEEPPEEWVAATAELSDEQLQNGLRQIITAGSPHAPSLPEFLKLCRTAREWTNTAHQLANDSFDRWAMAANRHMLAHVLRMAAKRRYYAPEATRVLVEWKNAWARDCREFDVGQGISVEDQQAWWADVMEKAQAHGAVTWTPTTPEVRGNAINRSDAASVAQA